MLAAIVFYINWAGRAIRNSRSFLDVLPDLIGAVVNLALGKCRACRQYGQWDQASKSAEEH